MAATGCTSGKLCSGRRMNSSWRASAVCVTPRAAAPNSSRCFGVARVSRGGFACTHAPLRTVGREAASLAVHADMKALILDVDGVIVDSGLFHLQAYNAAFEHFNVVGEWHDGPIRWTQDMYDALQREAGVGAGTEMLRCFFDNEGWPVCSAKGLSMDGAQREELLDTLQSWENAYYQGLVCSGGVEARPGVLRVMDEAWRKDLKVGVCSDAAKSCVEKVVQTLIGEERFNKLDVFLVGDDIPAPKPDPAIYAAALARLRIESNECVAIEGSPRGVDAAVGAGIRCCVTYTSANRHEHFGGAERIVKSLDENTAPIITVRELMERRCVQDDRCSLAVSESTVIFE